MATRSSIAFVGKDGKVKSSYCHWDGYPANNGAILLIHYQEPKKVKDLLSFGDISTLKKSVFPSEGSNHSYGNPENNVTVFYGRDRGEDSQGNEFYSFDKYKEENGFQEYDYVYFEAKQRWYLYNPAKDKLTTLSSEVKKAKKYMNKDMEVDYSLYLKEQEAKKLFKKMKETLPNRSEEFYVFKPKL